MSRKGVRLALSGIAVAVLGFFALCLMRGGLSAPSEQTLAKALAGVDRIRVRSGGTCHRNIVSERTLFEETEPTKIEGIIQAIRIDTASSGFHCGCCGFPSIEFYCGEALVVTLGCHHGIGIRWREGWRGDGLMTADCAASLDTWLASRGVNWRQHPEAGEGP
jgi:hypothetical protein